MKNMTIKFHPDEKEISVKRATTLLDAARQVGVKIESLCGGRGSCGKCRIIVEKGAENLGGLTEIEKCKLSLKEINQGYRLACCSRVTGNITVTVPEESRGGIQRVLIEGVETLFEIDPLIKKFTLKLPRPSLGDQRPDFERLVDRLREKYGLKKTNIAHDALKRLPNKLREGNWEATVTVWDEKEIIDLQPGNTLTRNYGIALDIGTITVVGYLIDLNTGKLLGISSILNPQVQYGEDVMTRITFAMENPSGLKKLNEEIITGVNEIINNVCREKNVGSEEISELTVVGNTAMHHLFLGLCPKYLAISPFTPVIQRSLDVKAKNLGFNVKPNANVHVLPTIAGFVGADNVGVILATGLHKSKKLMLAMDIGTNGEIALGNRDGITVCSCAAGPAFEGARIKFGMKATSGAIEKVKIEPDTLRVDYETIDDAKARGLCGSGIVDAIAEMLKTGVVLPNGRINRELKHPRLRITEKGSNFVLAWGNETATGVDITLTQSDVREIQLAKAAVYAGAFILMKRAGIAAKDLDALLLAGAFGSYMDKTSAKIIGLYPDMPLNRVRTVGNAAGAGARVALISKKARSEADRIAERARYVELTTAPEFKEEFMAAMHFPHSDMRRFPSLQKSY